MTITSPAVGDQATAAWADQVAADVNAPPVLVVYQTTGQSIGTAAFTTVIYDTVRVDSASGYSTITGKYTAAKAGWYYVDGQVSWAPNATGRRITSIFVNAAEQGESRNEITPTATAGTSLSAQASTIAFLNVGDTVDIRGFQSSGGALLTAVTPTRLNVHYLRPV